MAEFTATIPGKAAPKGSRVAGVTKTGVRFNREANPAVGVWMKMAKATLLERATASQHTPWDKSVPLKVDIRFNVERPKKSSYTYPPRGDVDKLCRAALDAMTGIVFEDDAQVIEIDALKVYSLGGSDTEIWVGPSYLV